MRRPIYVIAIALAAPVLPGVAQAELAFNVGAVSDYRYRGISQTRLKPALQGGLDFAAGGLYLGAWASSIQWIKDAGGGADLELDFYGGYKGEITKDVGFDVGVLAYQYPGHDLAVSPNTTELYGALTYGPFTAKYSHSVTNLFGFDGSKGSGYFDLTATFDLGDGWTVAPHIGRQIVKDVPGASYTDYAVTVGKSIGALSVTAALVATNTDAYIGGNGKDLGKSGVVLGAKYSF